MSGMTMSVGERIRGDLVYGFAALLARELLREDFRVTQLKEVERLVVSCYHPANRSGEVLVDATLPVPKPGPGRAILEVRVLYDNQAALVPRFDAIVGELCKKFPHIEIELAVTCSDRIARAS